MFSVGWYRILANNGKRGDNVAHWASSRTGPTCRPLGRVVRGRPEDTPMFRAGNIQYDLAEKTRGLACGGIGGMHLLKVHLTSSKTGPCPSRRHPLRFFSLREPDRAASAE